MTQHLHAAAKLAGRLDLVPGFPVPVVPSLGGRGSFIRVFKATIMRRKHEVASLTCLPP